MNSILSFVNKMDIATFFNGPLRSENNEFVNDVMLKGKI